MKFAVIKTKSRSCEIGEYARIEDALRAADLSEGKVDHGTLFQDEVVGAGIGIWVGEDSLFKERAQDYYAIGPRLFGGNAVLYQFDSKRETVDYEVPVPPIHWFKDINAVNRAIKMGVIVRPTLSIMGKIMWKWPLPV